YLQDVMGFDRNRGLMKESEHPLHRVLGPAMFASPSTIMKTTSLQQSFPPSMKWVMPFMNNKLIRL
ncbi:MAG TPA: hypothetical protein PK087_04390, partial [Bacilli bacterium]|nr:hypothetical protein [Bacilli bacterium]